MSAAQTLLSFDIGTRHLAYCALQHQPPTADAPYPRPTITHWAVVDLMAVKGTPHEASCVYVLCKSWKVAELRQYLDTNHLSSVGKRAELIARIHKHLKAQKVPKVAGTNLNVLSTQMYAYLDRQPWMLTCDTVVLENQPSLTNPIMKSVQILLYSYFQYKGVWCVFRDAAACAAPSPPPPPRTMQRVMLTSATNKLKVCQMGCASSAAGAHAGGDSSASSTSSNASSNGTPEDAVAKKSKYKQRKKDAIALAAKLLQTWSDDEADTSTPASASSWHTWQALLDTSCTKAQDDLSDSFLQGLYVVWGGSKRTKSKARAS